MKIRKAKKRDIGRCIDIAKSLEEWLTGEGVDACIREMPELEVYVYDDEKILGFIAYRDKGKEVAEIAWFGVERGSHRKGVGTALLNYLESQLPEKKMLVLKTVDESVDKNLYEAKTRFYQKNGFIKVDTLEGLQYWSFPCAVYIKSLR